MTETVWNDQQIQTGPLFFIFFSLAVIIFLPLLPIIFNKIRNIFLYMLEVYPIILVAICIVILYVYFEKKRLLYTIPEGIVIRWALETGSIELLIKWDKIKRISIVNSWSPKNYFRWKKIRPDLSWGLILKSIIGSRMMIIETDKDKVYFVDIIDQEGFVESVEKIAKSNHIVSEIPVLMYG